MTQRQEAARETRRKIVEAGFALVRSGGFAEASVEAITHAAGVAKGTFYVHFPTKEHLAAEICREPYENLSRDVMAAKGPLPSRIARLFLGWAVVADETGVECIRELFRIMLSPEVATNLGLALAERDRSVVESLLHDAVASGEIRPETPIQPLAETLFAQIRGLAIVWCMSPSGRGSLLAAADRFLRNHLPALLAPHLEQTTKTQKGTTTMTIHDFTAKGRNGTSLDLASLKGKVLLIVNTATGCGFTPQYEGLEKLYAKYHAQGLEILDFPCDQFGHQAPGSDDEIHNFCALKYNTSFDQLAKIEVNGPGADPIFAFLKAARPKDDASDDAIAGLRDLLKKHGLAGAEAPGDIEWNFTKFLIDKDGNIVKRFHPTTTPETIDAEIAALL